MTGYAAASAEGRAASREATTGRRKVLAERIEYGKEDASPGYYGYRTRPVYLIGSCGHRLRWRAGYPVTAGDPPDFVRRLGRKMTCDHADCRIPAKPEVPDAERCEYVMGVDVERRCATRSRFETEMGRVCRKHRDHYVREGYLSERPSPAPAEPCVPNGFHCWHWSYSFTPCCHCGSVADSEDDRCRGRTA